MNDLVPRKGSPLSRDQRVERGYRLVVAGGVGGAVAVVGAVLAIAGIIGWTIPILGVAVAAVCALLFRRLARRA